jgi:PBP1b-binding outer membrane lipoprotein LpoB
MKKQLYSMLALILFIVSCSNQDKTQLPESNQNEVKIIQTGRPVMNIVWMDPSLRQGC